MNPSYTRQAQGEWENPTKKRTSSSKIAVDFYSKITYNRLKKGMYFV